MRSIELRGGYGRASSIAQIFNQKGYRRTQHCVILQCRNLNRSDARPLQEHCCSVVAGSRPRTWCSFVTISSALCLFAAISMSF